MLLFFTHALAFAVGVLTTLHAFKWRISRIDDEDNKRWDAEATRQLQAAADRYEQSLREKNHEADGVD
jgi:hypothetical protein